MSIENLREYARRCAVEPDLRDKAKEIGVSDTDAHMRHAESLGLEWELSDLHDFRKEMIDAGGDSIDDLSEIELEEVAGGIAATSVVVAVAVGAGVGTTVAAVGSTAAAGGAAAAGDGGW